MEYKNYISLKEFLIDQKLSRESCKRLFLKVCLAVSKCHLLGVVHRDIKLENVIIGMKGEILLIDFGFSEILSHENREGKFICCGTLNYIAPEVLLSKIYDRTFLTWHYISN